MLLSGQDKETKNRNRGPCSGWLSQVTKFVIKYVKTSEEEFLREISINDLALDDVKILLKMLSPPRTIALFSSGCRDWL